MFATGSAWLRGVRIRGFRFLAEQRVRTLKVLKLEIFDLVFLHHYSLSALASWDGGKNSPFSRRKSYGLTKIFFFFFFFFLKIWWPDATLFYFISFSFIHTIHSHILTSINIRRGSSPLERRLTKIFDF
jgi:hypothetical protein